MVFIMESELIGLRMKMPEDFECNLMLFIYQKLNEFYSYDPRCLCCCLFVQRMNLTVHFFNKE